MLIIQGYILEDSSIPSVMYLMTLYSLEGTLVAGAAAVARHVQDSGGEVEVQEGRKEETKAIETIFKRSGACCIKCYENS